MLQDDGDIVRGLGFVTMHSAWVEEEVDNLLRQLSVLEEFDEKKQRWPISRKLKHAEELVLRLNSSELKYLPEALRAAADLFERRNDVIHGRIYAGYDRTDYMQSGRPNVPTREITSAELYQLANDFRNYSGGLFGPQLFRLPRAIEKFISNAP